MVDPEDDRLLQELHERAGAVRRQMDFALFQFFLLNPGVAVLDKPEHRKDLEEIFAAYSWYLTTPDDRDRMIFRPKASQHASPGSKEESTKSAEEGQTNLYNTATRFVPRNQVERLYTQPDVEEWVIRPPKQQSSDQTQASQSPVATPAIKLAINNLQPGVHRVTEVQFLRSLPFNGSTHQRRR